MSGRCGAARLRAQQLYNWDDITQKYEALLGGNRGLRGYLSRSNSHEATLPSYKIQICTIYCGCLLTGTIWGSNFASNRGCFYSLPQENSLQD